MYTLPLMKVSRRWRRLLWRLNGPVGSSTPGVYATWVGSTMITLGVMRMAVSSAGPADTRECL